MAVSKLKEINGVISESLNDSCSCITDFFLSPFSVGWVVGVAHSSGGFVQLKMALKNHHSWESFLVIPNLKGHQSTFSLWNLQVHCSITMTFTFYLVA